jgi:hypothetical protein
MASNFSNQKYEAAKVDALYQRVLHGSNTGSKQDYEIRVDDFKAVPRNSDPALFFSYEEFIKPETTQKLTVLMFKGGTTSSDRYNFFFHQVPGEQSLNGIGEQDRDRVLNEQIKRLEAEYEIKGLKDKNEKLEEEKEDLEEEIDELKGEIARLKDGGNMALGNVLTIAGEKLLPGMFGTNKPQNQVLQGTPQEEASYKKQGTPEQKETAEENAGENTVAIPKEDLPYFALLSELKKIYTPEELSSFMLIVNKLSANKHALFSTNKHIDSFLKQKPKKEDE